jgi:hypothetical protein
VSQRERDRGRDGVDETEGKRQRRKDGGERFRKKGILETDGK